MADNGLLAYQMAEAARAQDQLYNLILMDIQMPIMDGYSATGRLREREFELPIIALTAHAMPQERGRCIEAGFTDYANQADYPSQSVGNSPPQPDPYGQSDRKDRLAINPVAFVTLLSVA